jgi:hypothetical protein
MNLLRIVTGFAACCFSGVSLLGTATRANAGLSLTPAGLFGQYYDGYWNGNSNFFTSGTPVFTRNDQAISFSDALYNNDYPPSLNPWGFAGTTLEDEETFSVSWHGFLQVDTADTYVLRTRSDDAILVNINNTAVVSNTVPHSPSYDEGAISLTAGLYPIKMFYGEQFIHSVAQLEWKVASASTFSLMATGAPLSAAPAPLPLLGAWAALGFSRKLRLRLKR